MNNTFLEGKFSSLCEFFPLGKPSDFLDAGFLFILRRVVISTSFVN
jgi:hypothetical protein